MQTMKNEVNCGKGYTFGWQLDKQAIPINHYYMKAENKVQHHNLPFKKKLCFVPKSA